MEKDQPTEVSPHFLPSPNQINKIKTNLKKDTTALDEVTKLYNSVSVAVVPTREPTLSELTRLKFGLVQLKERNTDYTHFEVATVRHNCSIFHQTAASVRDEITSVLNIQIFHYFMSIKQHVEFPHYGGKDVTFLLERSQSYDCIKNFAKIRSSTIPIEGACSNGGT